MAKRRLSRRQIARIKELRQQRRTRHAERAERAAQNSDSSALGPTQSGLVITNFGPALIVEDRAEQLYRCSARQNLGPIVSGDRVLWQASSAESGVVIDIEPRRSLLARPDYHHQIKPLAANLDLIIVVCAPRPEPSEFLIDRYLVAITVVGAKALLLLNKADLLSSADLAQFQHRFATYQTIGYPLLAVSSRNAQGLDALQRQLQQHTSILVGQSGVGKSSLVKTLLPELDIRTRALSSVTGLGTHTTSRTTLYHLPKGGDLIDSPGVRNFEPAITTLEALQQGFIEFAPYLGRCRFSNCNHTVEPDCALQTAVQTGHIDSRRLESFQQIKAALQERERY